MEHKFCKNHLSHMTKIDPCPHMVKTFKNLLLQNRKFYDKCFISLTRVPNSRMALVGFLYDLETWHATSRTEALQSCINSDPELTFTYFTARSNLVACVFEW